MAVREQVSGPGKLAKRTDKNVSKQPTRYIGGGSYGEGQEILAQQQAAPMAAKPQTSANLTPSAVRGMMEKVVPLMAPTQRPDEPITAGMPFGMGPGPEAMELPIPQAPKLTSVLEELMRYDDTGDIAEIYNSVVNRGL
jgi:hypothetical protein